MQNARPSRTALATAFARAAHLCLDDAPPVFEDAVAARLLPGYQRRMLRRLALISQPWARRLRSGRDAFTAMRTQIVVRARYAEDALKEGDSEGRQRYVVLAAGLDTFALRQNREGEQRLPVLEIDHPATQSWKRDLLTQRKIPVPRELTFLPIDFEQNSLSDAWIGSQAPDFISWLGTTYYLTGEAIANTLTTLAKSTQTGTRLVLDFWCEPPAWNAGSFLLLGTRFAVAMQQEPMHSFFKPREIEALANSAGWRVKEICSPAEQNRRYLQNRRDRLSVPAFSYLLHLEH